MYSQNNIESLFKLIGNIQGNTYTNSNYFDIIKSENSIWPNLIFNLNYNNFNDVINELELKKNDLKFPNLLMIDSDIKNIEVINYFNAKYKSGYWTAMSHNLQHLNKSDFNNFEIKEVCKTSDLDKWIKIVENELMGSHSLDKKIFDSLMNSENTKLLLGLVSNQAVSTSLIYTKDGVSGIYLVSTLSTHRKKGYGLEMTNYCLYRAKMLNSIRVDIQSTNSGYKTYLKAGFMDNGKINVFNLKEKSNN